MKNNKEAKNNLNIHIVGGNGQMGSWLRNFLENKGFTVSVSGRDSDLKKDLNNVEVVFISVPISVASEVIKNVKRRAAKNAVMIDMSSVMSFSEKELESWQGASACMHLLFGPTVSAIASQQVIFNVIKNSPHIEMLKNLMVKDGAIISDMSSQQHDQTMAHIQSLTHFVNLSLAKTLIDNKININGKISTPVYLAQLSAISRVISQNPNLLTEIQLNNPVYTDVLNDYFRNQQVITQHLVKQDYEGLTKIFEAVNDSLESKGLHRIKKVEKSSLNFKTDLKIGYLGPEGTFSHQAALRIAGTKDRQLVACETIYQIFEMVSNDKVALGVVPAENSTEGTVRETLDYLIEFNLKVKLSLDIDIHQNLLSKLKNISSISRVLSHPQGLAQCRKWLQEYLPNALRENTKSTLSAIETDADKEGVAFIGSDLAAKIYGLNIIAANIEDNHQNVTKFYVISKEDKLIDIKTNKTLLFLSVYNRVGILRDVLDVFARDGINLSRLESRPSREKVWDYHFFIEVEASKDDHDLVNALNILKQYCPLIIVLGGV